MNLHKQKEKINALSIRMITWADRAKLPTSNQQNHIPEVDRDGKIVKYHKKPDGYYVVYHNCYRNQQYDNHPYDTPDYHINNRLLS